MNKSKLITVSLFFLLLIVLFVIKYMISGDKLLVSPGVTQVNNQPTGQPAISSYNPPQAIKYDSSTDLKEELESINPKVEESDFN